MDISRIKQALRNKPTRHDVVASADTIFNSIKKDQLVNKIVNRRNRKKTNKNTPQQTPLIANSIFFSGGVGDVLALESFMSDQHRRAVDTICYGTNKHHWIEPLFRALPNSFPNLTNHLIVWDNFSKFWCFSFKSECEQAMRQSAPKELLEAEDWGILPKFAQINSGLLRYTGSSFVQNKLCDVSRFPLPVQYVVLSPYSTDKRLKGRDFTDADWAITLYYLMKFNIQGVVLNVGQEEYVPDSSFVTNLTNKTTILEAIEIVKGAKGFIGIDSSLSVVAAKLFDPPYFYVKSRNDHCFAYKHIYYAPKKSFEFIGSDLTKVIKF
jgi:hypothetical protein